jgi:IPT/TIG domain
LTSSVPPGRLRGLLRPGGLIKALSCLAVLGCFAVFAAGSGAQDSQTNAGHIGGIVKPPHSITRLSQFVSVGPCDYVPFCEDLTYHGGPVMHTSTTHAIYWLPTGYTSGDGMQPYDATYQSLIAQYFSDLEAASGVVSNVYGVGVQYYDDPGQVHITTGQTYGGSYVDTATPFPADGCTDPTGEAAHCLTDDQLQAEITHVINVMGWPKGTSNIYFLLTPEGVESCTDGSLFAACSYTDYCAYHGFYGSGSNTVIYANQPYPKLANDPFFECGVSEYPNGGDADEQINVLSHEHREAINDATLDAWYADTTLYEGSDQCAWYFGKESGSTGAKYNQTINGHHYHVQLEWSNDGSTCLASYVGPTVSKVSPVHGVVGQPITIKGKDFEKVTAVDFNGTAADSFTRKGSKLTAVVGAGTTTGPVHLTWFGGTASGPTFTLDPSPAPTIKSFKPASTHVGNTVTVTGTGFWGTSAVKVNGVDVQSFAVKSASKLTFVVAGGNTSGTIAVTTPGGTVTTAGTLTIE